LFITSKILVLCIYNHTWRWLVIAETCCEKRVIGEHKIYISCVDGTTKITHSLTGRIILKNKGNCSLLASRGRRVACRMPSNRRSHFKIRHRKTKWEIHRSISQPTVYTNKPGFQNPTSHSADKLDSEPHTDRPYLWHRNRIFSIYIYIYIYIYIRVYAHTADVLFRALSRGSSIQYTFLFTPTIYLSPKFALGNSKPSG
jgi:hypothetical protein